MTAVCRAFCHLQHEWLWYLIWPHKHRPSFEGGAGGRQNTETTKSSNNYKKTKSQEQIHKLTTPPHDDPKLLGRDAYDDWMGFLHVCARRFELRFLKLIIMLKYLFVHLKQILKC